MAAQVCCWWTLKVEYSPHCNICWCIIQNDMQNMLFTWNFSEYVFPVANSNLPIRVTGSICPIRTSVGRFMSFNEFTKKCWHCVEAFCLHISSKQVFRLTQVSIVYVVKSWNFELTSLTWWWKIIFLLLTKLSAILQSILCQRESLKMAVWWLSWRFLYSVSCLVRSLSLFEDRNNRGGPAITPTVPDEQKLAFQTARLLYSE